MLQDLRFALRQLLKSPGFSLVAILTLALAIGANTAIFSAIDAVLLHPLPYPDPDRLVIVQETLPRYSLHGIAPTAADYTEFRREATCFTQIAAVSGAVATLTGDGQPEDVPAQRVTASAFPMLGVVPILGGLFTSDDDQLGRDHVAILSEGLWTRRYGRDRSIVGKNIQINRESYRIAGVIRPIFVYRVNAGLWMPLAFDPSEAAPGTRGPHNIDVIGRLKPGRGIEQARDEFRRIAALIVEQYPDQVSMDRGFSIDLRPLAEKQAGDLKTPLLVLIAAVGALMLIACANVSNHPLGVGRVARSCDRAAVDRKSAACLHRRRRRNAARAVRTSSLRAVRSRRFDSRRPPFHQRVGHGLFHFRVDRREHAVRPGARARNLANRSYGSAQRRLARIDHGTQAASRIDGRLRSLRFPGAFDRRRSLGEKLRSPGAHQSRIPIRKCADRVRILTGRAIPGTRAKGRLRTISARTRTHDSGRALRRNDRFPSLQWRLGKRRSRDCGPSAKSK